MRGRRAPRRLFDQAGVDPASALKGQHKRLMVASGARSAVG